MSLVTALAPFCAPPAANGLQVSSGVPAWVLGSYVQFIASFAADSQLAALHHLAPAAAQEYELVVGVGAAGFEVNTSTIRGVFMAGAASSPSTLDLPAPENAYPLGSRLALAIRMSDITVTPDSTETAITYYANLDSDQQTDLAIVSLPPAANGASITSSAVAWTNSAIAEITSGIGLTLSIISITLTKATTNTVYELDLLTGAMGAEVVITTIKGPIATANPFGISPVANLTAAYPLDPNTRVSARLRKSGTAVVVFRVGLNVYLESVVPPIPPGSVTQTIRRMRIFNLPFNENKRLQLRRLELFIEQGQGLLTGLGSAPVLMVSMSKDGGFTWGPERFIEAGPRGAYQFRSMAYNWGQYRNGAIKVVVSDPVVWNLVSAFGQLDEGSS